MAAGMLTDKNAGRVELGKVLPLDAPFSVQMYVANICNFRCGYCLQSAGPGVLRDKSFPRKFMDFGLYKSCIDGFADLKKKLKVLVLVGWGEPLLHPRVADMIEYARLKDVAEKVEIITNAAALTPALARRVTEAGIDSVRISIQGLCAGDYRRVSGVDINFEEFVSNIKYFYEHKRSANVYIKIMDVLLEKPGDREKFFRLFGEICDEIAVESLIPLLSDFDYSNFPSDFSTGLMGNKILHTDICALPFYSCIVDVDGYLLPCCVFPAPARFANVAEQGLAAVWNGAAYRAFLIKLLKREKARMPVCGKCHRHTRVMRPGDYLDDYAEELLRSYETIK